MKLYLLLSTTLPTLPTGSEGSKYVLLESTVDVYRQMESTLLREMLTALETP